MRQPRRLIRHTGDEAKLGRSQMGELMLLLDSLNFELVFVDEFTVNNNTHSNYNWQKPGLSQGVPLAKTWPSYSCIAAVSRQKLEAL